MVSQRGMVGGALVLLGAGLLAYAASTGDLRVGLFLVVPYAYGTGLVPFLGFVLLTVGGFLLLTSRFGRVGAEAPPGWVEPPAGEGPDAGSPRAERRAKHGGFVLLGPIPIAWGNDRRLLPWLALLGLALLLLALTLPGLLTR